MTHLPLRDHLQCQAKAIAMDAMAAVAVPRENRVRYAALAADWRALAATDQVDDGLRAVLEQIRRDYRQ